MRSTFHGLETAKRSLFTQRTALDTTGHNIANANTAGYTRQVVSMVAGRPMEAPGLSRSSTQGQIGTGVEFSAITRIREKFLDDQFRNENKSFGSWQIQSDTLDKLESIINEPSDNGLRTVMDNFWKSWSDLSKDPENITGRKIVRENAKALTDVFNYTSKQLSDLQNDLTYNIGVQADKINNLTNRITALNKEIFRIEGLGDSANDLRDQRDLYSDELSKIVNIQVIDTPNGYNINMGSVNLVNMLSVTEVSRDSLVASFSSGELNSGEVHGMIVARDHYVTDYVKQLDTLANSIANGKVRITLQEGTVLPDGTKLDVVNADGTITEDVEFTGSSRTISGTKTVLVDGLNGLHRLGYTVMNPLTPGGNFFTSKSGSATITAADMQLSSLIEGDASYIATSMRTYTPPGKTSEEVIKGNNFLALQMGGLKDSTFQFGGTGGGSVVQSGTLNDFVLSVVGQLGVQSEEAKRMMENQKVLVDQVESRRQAVSGVSLDEEMSNMIKFQHAYNASSRIMTAIDEMLDRIINGMGQVGR